MVSLCAMFLFAAAFGGEQAGVSKSDYLDFMEAAVRAYSDERLVSYQAEAERDGVQKE